MRDCLEWAIENLPFSPCELLAMATTNPARLIGVSDRVVEGGDSVLLEGGRVVTTTVAGTELHHA